MYASGVVTWVLARWFQVDAGFGPQPREQRVWWLDGHSTISLWFLILFGAMYKPHVVRAWHAKRKLASGLSVVSPFIFLIATVPFLFYLRDEQAKSYVAIAHTYVGLALVIPFVVHLVTKRK